jgi:hypothetical protein
MSDEARALRWAKQVWSEAPASESEIERGADRVARRFAVPRRALVPRHAWKIAGLTAVVLGALGYANRGAWIVRRDPPRNAEPAVVERAVDAPPSPAPNEPSPALQAAPPPAPADTAVSAPSSNLEKKGRRSMPQAPAVETPGAPEPTWVEVSDALAAQDHARAEKLLIELSNNRHDPNTRAKAHLGLAQLDESKNDCESARKHALYAASIPDIEIKTVRRALELAARCTR